MFSQYTTIDDVMAGEGRQAVMDELNSTPLYCRVVAALEYTRIGIIVLDEGGREQSRYVSENAADGRITAIRRGFRMKDPDIVVRVKDSVLMHMLGEIETLKAHPYRSFFGYVASCAFLPGRISKDLVKLGIDLPGMVTRLFLDSYSATRSAPVGEDQSYS